MNETEFEFIDGDKVKLLINVKSGSMTFAAGHTCIVLHVFRVSPDGNSDKTEYIVDPDVMDEDGSYESTFIVKGKDIVKSLNETEFL